MIWDWKNRSSSRYRQGLFPALRRLVRPPARQLKLAGITGTNGKTSSTTILRDVLEHAGHKAGLIGTIQIEYDGKTFPNPNTTPDSWLFQKTLRDMVDAGCDFAVTEVSSHALVQQRLYGCEFAAAAFTNLTQDHLDYHKTMEAYFQAKTMLVRLQPKSGW